jgi:SpoVK/Ycf46/Vps4 family AAA+-type ATPase
LFLSTEHLDRIDLEDVLTPTSIDLPVCTAGERRRLWGQVIPATADPAGELVEQLVRRFPGNPGDILGARADVNALLQKAGGLLDRDEVTRVVAVRSRHNLRAIAAEIRADHTLDDIVLPEPVRVQCLRLVELVERWDLLRDTWGIARRLHPHRGVSALFYGPPGTGKTMMAGILGRRLGLDVYRVDVAQVLSKWVGETEKNLSRVFAEAARTRAVLVFDEADALFAKRTDVKSSVDRYSNAQVNYLLARMESFEGVLVLTTNLERGIDEAFLRRLHFRIRFPEPGAGERAAIWRRTIPPEVALADDVDLDALAADFAISGALIRSAALRACLIATMDPARAATARLHMNDLRQAVTEELGSDPRRREDGTRQRTTMSHLY